MTDNRAHVLELRDPITFDEMVQAVFDARAQGHFDLRLKAGTAILGAPGPFPIAVELQPGDRLMGIVVV